MKTLQTLMLIVALLLAGPMAIAQDFMDALKQTAEMHNEANAENNNDDNSNELTPQQEEWQRQWEAEWQLQQTAEIMEAFDTKYLKCTFMMILYVYEYLTLVGATKAEGNCKMKYDLYGMQLLYLAGSTSIMNCPEEMASLSVEQQIKILEDFENILIEKNGLDGIFDHNTDNSELDAILNLVAAEGPFGSLLNKYFSILNMIEYIWSRESINYTGEPFSRIKLLTTFFNPSFIIPRTLEIGQKMEALGCGG